MAEGCGAQERQQLVQAQPAKSVSSGGRALPGGRGMWGASASAPPAGSACARALRANRETSCAARWQYCPSLRWQGETVFIKQKLEGQRRSPPQNLTTGPR